MCALVPDVEGSVLLAGSSRRVSGDGGRELLPERYIGSNSFVGFDHVAGVFFFLHFLDTSCVFSVPFGTFSHLPFSFFFFLLLVPVGFCSWLFLTLHIVVGLVFIPCVRGWRKYGWDFIYWQTVLPLFLFLVLFFSSWGRGLVS